ncbi:hypothetical protein C1645_820900, partial [Glomus cerebriforme]
SLSSSVQDGKEKWFSELFGPEWEGKTILQTLQSGLARENDSPSVQTFGIRKQ